MYPGFNTGIDERTVTVAFGGQNTVPKFSNQYQHPTVVTRTDERGKAGCD
jgi:hypothetical protein